MKKLGILILLLATGCCVTLSESVTSSDSEVGIWNCFELQTEHPDVFDDPYRDTELQVTLTAPDGEVIHYWGFYDGGQTWKIRFSPNRLGEWRYEYWFKEKKNEVVKGSFKCVGSTTPGMVALDESNPFWLGLKGGEHRLFRSFHVGDRFFATNWDDPADEEDGNPRTAFLNWFQENGYNMMSVASHYTNRQEKSRGEGWETPKLWPLDYREFQKMEIILDELCERDITIYPFAGFFGAKGEWPAEHDEQELYIRYILARIGHYPNTILTVAGPEPFWRQDKSQYGWNMRMDDIVRLGKLIDENDVHDHVLTIHNEKRATKYGDPFIYDDWYEMSTLQGPTTLDRDELFGGLVSNHHPEKACFAQETLWFGNMFHPKYTNDDIRRNTLAILFAGAILNFADMNGNSSSGFSGTLDFEDLHQEQHDIVHKVWDWFETIPYYRFRTHQELVRNGFCLAEPGEEYYIYLDFENEFRMDLDYPHTFQSEWINAVNFEDVREGPELIERVKIRTPDGKPQWILHIWKSEE